MNYLEFAEGDSREEQIEYIRDIWDKHPNRTVRATSIFAVFSVGEMRQHVANKTLDKRDLSVVWEPARYDITHAGIHGIKFEEDLIADLVAAVATDTYPARKP